MATRQLTHAEYLHPPYLPMEKCSKFELYPGEYSDLLHTVQDCFKRNLTRLPATSSDDEATLAQKWLQGVFWSRYTSDPGYYAAVYRDIGHLLTE